MGVIKQGVIKRVREEVLVSVPGASEALGSQLKHWLGKLGDVP